MKTINEEILEVSTDGPFVFETPLDGLSEYDVTVVTQPTDPRQICTVSDGSGFLAVADSDTTVVTCTVLPEAIFINGFEEEQP